ncbi:MAG TPA: hypothetical protein PKB11_01460 [Desulfovibrio sp.]|jgi:hypothetical protein|uniref:hypothetical protein n=1 Tax=Desulfovibrio TaxID=872 RepID=UPI0004267355|nr:MULTISPECIES: hypothetical protein [Desulfovibrio]MDY0307193.1 hypothetical protein [Desulfovibrionaceae bacterium]HMM37399.1 hypothetical protein [Desulfovibrio sp.]
MIPAEVWAGLALFFGAIWVLVRVVDSRRTAAKVRVTADTVPTAYRLTKTFLGLVPAHSDTLGDAARLPRSKAEIGRALKTMIAYHAARGEHGQAARLKAAYVALASFQNADLDPRKAETLASAERRRLSQDIEHFLANSSI